jgi:hypothetical protein
LRPGLQAGERFVEPVERELCASLDKPAGDRIVHDRAGASTKPHEVFFESTSLRSQSLLKELDQLNGLGIPRAKDLVDHVPDGLQPDGMLGDEPGDDKLVACGR